MESLVSVIVPVYKAEAFIERCVKSIQAQTYGNIEIILVDDGSPDRSGEICDALARTDGRIKVIHQDNQNVGPARNAGIEIAGGEWIMFVDADDEIEPEMVEGMLCATAGNESDLVVCGYKHTLMPYGYVLDKKPSEMRSLTPEEFYPIYVKKWFAINGFFAGPCSKLYRSSIIKGNNVRFPNRNFEDSYFVSDYLKETRRNISFVNESYYHYLVIEGAETVNTRGKTEEHIQLLNYVFDNIIQSAPEIEEMAKRTRGGQSLMRRRQERACKFEADCL